MGTTSLAGFAFAARRALTTGYPLCSEVIRVNVPPRGHQVLRRSKTVGPVRHSCRKSFVRHARATERLRRAWRSCTSTAITASLAARPVTTVSSRCYWDTLPERWTSTPMSARRYRHWRSRAWCHLYGSFRIFIRRVWRPNRAPGRITPRSPVDRPTIETAPLLGCSVTIS